MLQRRAEDKNEAAGQRSSAEEQPQAARALETSRKVKWSSTEEQRR